MGPHGGLQVGKYRFFGAPISKALIPVYPAANGAKLVGPHGGLQVDEWAVYDLLLPDSYSRLLLILPDSYSPSPTITPRL